MTNRFTNFDIKNTFTFLRAQFRSGATTVSVRTDKFALRKAVAEAFGIQQDAFNTDNFNPQTFKRLAHLFDVPFLDHGDHQHYPSQDDIATALQNFINRRKDVWSHFHLKGVKADLSNEHAAV